MRGHLTARPTTPSAQLLIGLAIALLLAIGLVALLPATAHAAARVSVANPQGQAKIDPTYATTLRLSGTGFQSIKGGHGGVYVVFGAVTDGWRPSKGGVTGKDYFYVPDSEAKDNQGFQRYVAFPGSSTASSANGGTMSATGSWSTEIVVPGAVFKAQDRAGNVRTVDCRKSRCGVITFGAHGVTNANNETFTPVSVGSLGQPAGTATPGGDQTVAPDGGTDAPDIAPPSDAPSSDPVPAGTPALEVDRAAAIAGNVLSFTATGLPPGAQVSAVFDDGAAGAGPFAVGPDGQVTGVIGIPADTAAGTHELRLYGVEDPPAVNFAVQAGPVEDDASAASDASDSDDRAAWLFVGAAALVLVLALIRLGWRFRRRPRAS